MNDAHFHLMINHIPIIFPIAGALVLLAGIIFKSEIVKRTAYFVFVLGAGSAAVAMSSGEGAEEVVEHIQGTSHRLIHEHEEAAEFFALMSYIFGALSLVGLWASWKKKGFASIISYLILAMSVVVIIFGKQTGTSGGEVRHTEIRSEAANNAAQSDQSETGEEEEEEEEEE